MLFDKVRPMLLASQLQPASLAQHQRWAWYRRAWFTVAAYFRQQTPRFWVALVPALVVSALVYSRNPASNFIFDEQEALLANPYVNGEELGFLDAFRRDFWGLAPTRTIGSYRPLPNLIWWVLWRVSELPWLPHWVNIVVHAANAALVAALVFRLSKDRELSWLSGSIFLLAAVITEAVTGVVGLADVLGGLGVLLALHSLRLPLWLMPFAVGGSTLFGLFSKESVLVAVPLVGWVALVTAGILHPQRPWRVPRALLAWVFCVLALVGYTYFRRHFFPVTLPESLRAPLPDAAPVAERALHEFMRWFQQPRLPRDAINNPLVDAEGPERVAGALRVYLHGLGQVVFPYSLSGDYSYAAEPSPRGVLSAKSIVGGLLMFVPPLLGIVCWVVAWRREAALRTLPVPMSQAAGLGVSGWVLLAIGLIWVPVAYFPHSNIPTLLPTVRAERFWYLPVIGSSLVIALIWSRWLAHDRPRALMGLIVFLGFQGLQARTHALHFSHDLAFWRAARNAVPNSAKAHLNYAVMVGARGDLDERLAAGRRAIEIAPDWPMAHVYQGDALCRLSKERRWNGKQMATRAFPYYSRGFDLGPNDVNLIALGLQCLYDHEGLKFVADDLRKLADKHPASWLDYLVHDTLEHGDEHKGVNPKYRPRGYNEGPKQRESKADD